MQGQDQSQRNVYLRFKVGEQSKVGRMCPLHVIRYTRSTAVCAALTTRKTAFFPVAPYGAVREQWDSPLALSHARFRRHSTPFKDCQLLWLLSRNHPTQIPPKPYLTLLPE